MFKAPAGGGVLCAAVISMFVIRCSAAQEARIDRRFVSHSAAKGEPSADPNAQGSTVPPGGGNDPNSGDSEPSAQRHKAKRNPVLGVFLLSFQARPAENPPSTETPSAQEKSAFLQYLKQINAAYDPSEPVLEVVYGLKNLPMMVIKIGDARLEQEMSERPEWRLQPISYVKATGVNVPFNIVGLNPKDPSSILGLPNGVAIPPANRPTVAVVDGGIDPSMGQGIFGASCNPAASIQDPLCRIKAWKSFIMGEESAAPFIPDFEHGAVVGGIIAKVSPDAIGLVSLRSFKKNHEGQNESNEADILAAIDWAIGSKKNYQLPLNHQDPDYLPAANIVALNMSLSLWDGSFFQGFCSEEGRSYETAFHIAREVGILPIVAAGNEGTYADGLPIPACVKGAVSVGAIEAIDPSCLASNCSETANVARKSSFSNVSDCLSIFAPGTDATLAGLTLANGTPKIFEGTSFATPYVASAVAMVAALDPSQSATQIEKKILSNAGSVTLNRRSSLASYGEESCRQDPKSPRFEFKSLNFKRLMDVMPPNLSRVATHWFFAPPTVPSENLLIHTETCINKQYLFISDIEDDSSGIASVDVFADGRPLAAERIQPNVFNFPMPSLQGLIYKADALCLASIPLKDVTLEIRATDHSGKKSQRTMVIKTPPLDPPQMAKNVKFVDIKQNYVYLGNKVTTFTLRWKAATHPGPVEYKIIYSLSSAAPDVSQEPPPYCDESRGFTELKRMTWQRDYNDWLNLEIVLPQELLSPVEKTFLTVRICAFDGVGRIAPGIIGQNTFQPK